MAEMERLTCESRIRVFEPLEQYRSVCSKVLVVCHGQHPHPIPQPLKTPPLIRLQIFKLLESLGQDLADLTPRRFLRHTSVCAYLRNTLPHILHPSLSDLHVSLSNREHLRVYIEAARLKAFPEGTGWDGMAHVQSLEHYCILKFCLRPSSFKAATRSRAFTRGSIYSLCG
jgi:hypothetical protein